MSDPRILLMKGNLWEDIHTRATLPILLGRLKNPNPQLTYLELNIAVAKSLGESPNGNSGAYHMVLRKIERILNTLSDSWSQGEIPPLTVLIVRGDKHLPGPAFDPFLSRYIEKINHGAVTKQNRASMIGLATRNVLEYKLWDAVAERLGIAIP